MKKRSMRPGGAAPSFLAAALIACAMAWTSNPALAGGTTREGQVKEAPPGKAVTIVEPAPAPPPRVEAPKRKEPFLHKLGRAALWYIPNRALDLVDAIRLNVTAGPTMGYSARCTEQAMGGILELDCHRIGFNGSRESFYEHAVIHNECGGRFFIWESGKIQRPKWEVGLDLHCFVGGQAGVDLDDLCDFVCGFALYDRHEDDRGPVWGNR